MEFDFVLKFFSKLYLQNTVLLSLIFLFFTYLGFHRLKLFKNPEIWYFNFLWIFCFGVILAFLVNLFLPFDKRGALIYIFIGLSLGISYFLLTGGIKSFFDDLAYLKKNFSIFLKKILFFLCLTLIFASYFNYSIFKTIVPFSWGVNIDLYAHTIFINRIQNETLINFSDCQNDNGCFIKHIFLSYPQGSHAFLAFVDKLLPFSFVNKTDYGFIIFGMLTVSIMALFMYKKIPFFVYLPLIFLPSYSLMLLRDHVNSALFTYPLFLIYYLLFYIFKKNTFYFKNALKFFPPLLASYLIYYFSLIFALVPLGLALLIIFISRNKKKTIFIIGLFSLAIVILTFKEKFNLGFFSNLINQVLLLSRNQHLVDVIGFNLRVNFLNFLGYEMFSYNYFYEYEKIIYLQYLTLIFWIFLFSLLLKLNRNILFFVIFHFLYFLFLDYKWGYSYLQIRYYSYLSVLLLASLLFFDKLKFSKTFQVMFLIVSIFTSYWFIKLHFDNHVYARTNAAKNIGLDYKIPSFTVKEAGFDKNVVIMHSQDFNRAFMLFIPYGAKNYYAYDRWGVDAMVKDQIIDEKKINYQNRKIDSLNLNKVDYLVVPLNFNYPSDLFEVVEKDLNSLLLRKKSRNL